MSEILLNVALEKQLADDYLSYSMSVILGRAIPDMRDGLKPVHRRILTAAKIMGLSPDSRLVKSAKLSGNVMSLLHPHGDCYGSIVTLSQAWTNNAPLIEGQGNWGSPTDGPASARYTECRTTPYAWNALLQESDTWETKPNYDGTLEEPIVLNTKFPNILTAETSGIAVGYATSCPPHNLKEIHKALLLLRDNKIIEAASLLLPDFPSGCDIIKNDGLRNYAADGHGSIKMRAKAEIIDFTDSSRKKNKTTKAIVFSNLPFGSNTEKISEEIKEALEQEKIFNVRDIIDGTDRTGVRLTVIGNQNVDIELLKESLYRHTSLENNYGAKLLVVHNQKPTLFSPIGLLQEWIRWRDNQFKNHLAFQKKVLEDKLHIIEGFLSALSQLDDVIDVIRTSTSPANALKEIIEYFEFTEVQAKAILDLTLSRLTRLEENELKDKAVSLQEKISNFKYLLENDSARLDDIYNQIGEIAKNHGTNRKSTLIAETSGTFITKLPKEKTKREFSFLKISKGGVLSQVKNSKDADSTIPFGSYILFICDDGKVYKYRSSYSGQIGNGKILKWFVYKENEGEDRFCFYGNGKWNSVSKNDLLKSTSKGTLAFPNLERVGDYVEGAPKKAKGSQGNIYKGKK